MLLIFWRPTYHFTSVEGDVGLTSAAERRPRIPLVSAFGFTANTVRRIVRAFDGVLPSSGVTTHHILARLIAGVAFSASYTGAVRIALSSATGFVSGITRRPSSTFVGSFYSLSDISITTRSGLVGLLMPIGVDVRNTLRMLSSSFTLADEGIVSRRMTNLFASLSAQGVVLRSVGRDVGGLVGFVASTRRLARKTLGAAFTSFGNLAGRFIFAYARTPTDIDQDPFSGTGVRRLPGQAGPKSRRLPDESVRRRFVGMGGGTRIYSATLSNAASRSGQTTGANARTGEQAQSASARNVEETDRTRKRRMGESGSKARYPGDTFPLDPDA